MQNHQEEELSPLEKVPFVHYSMYYTHLILTSPYLCETTNKYFHIYSLTLNIIKDYTFELNMDKKNHGYDAAIKYMFFFLFLSFVLDVIIIVKLIVNSKNITIRVNNSICFVGLALEHIVFTLQLYFNIYLLWYYSCGPHQTLSNKC